MTISFLRTCIAISIVLFFAAGGLFADNVEKADALYGAGKWADARPYYEQALPGLTGDAAAEIQNKIGYTYLRTHKREEAAEAFGKTLRLKDVAPQYRADAYWNRAYVFQLLRRHEAAAAEAQNATEVAGAPATTVQKAFLTRGHCLRALGRIEEAEASYRAIGNVADGIDHYTADGLMSIARFYQDQKKHKEALAEYKTVLTLKAGTKSRQQAQSGIAQCEDLLAGDMPFYVKPWVARVDGASANIYWISQGDVASGTVTVKPAGAADEKRIAVDATPIINTICALQKATVENLEAGVRYEYVATCGAETIAGSFRAPTGKGEPVKFAVLGDTQTHAYNHVKVAEAIARDNPDFVLHTGDLVDRSGVWGSHKRELLDPGWAYLRKSVLLPSVGNHDGGQFTKRVLDSPRDFYYGVNFGDVHVMVLDGYWFGGKPGREKQLRWLEEELEEHKDSLWKIVMVHIPMITTMEDGEQFGIDDFLPVMEAHGVDIVLSGHEHIYRRYLPIGAAAHKPVIHIVTGGGAIASSTSLPSPLAEELRTVLHHLCFHVDGNRLEMWAREPDGTTFDHMVLEKNNGVYQKEVMDKKVDIALARSVRWIYRELLADRVHRLVCDVDAQPAPGEKATLILDMERLPRGAFDASSLPAGLELVVRQREGNPWNVATQSFPLTEKKMAIAATAPDPASAPLELVLNLRYEGRLFEPLPVAVQFRDR